eukprot:5840222-Alexandrium_andersonii.AAC.1
MVARRDDDGLALRALWGLSARYCNRGSLARHPPSIPANDSAPRARVSATSVARGGRACA